jgi:hypothetical protein
MRQAFTSLTASAASSRPPLRRRRRRPGVVIFRVVARCGAARHRWQNLVVHEQNPRAALITGAASMIPPSWDRFATRGRVEPGL